MRSKGQSFLSGAFILMIATVIVKIIGAVFKIPLASILGGGGMGYYMTAYSIFGPAFALSVAGFSISVSKLSAAAMAQGRGAERKQILSVALIMFTAIGLILSAVIYFAAPLFVAMVDNPDSLRAVRAMAPALVFCCISSVFRGYYEGARNMVPTAVSQVTEAVTKLFCGLLFAFRSFNSAMSEFEMYNTVFGVYAADAAEAAALAAPYAASAAVAGVTVSTAAGCLAAVAFYLFSEKDMPQSGSGSITISQTAFALIRTAMPVSAAALVVNIASMVDLMSVMNRINTAALSDWNALCQSRPELLLADVAPERAANFLYGAYTGVAMTIFNIAPAFTSSMGVCALPMISALAARGRKALLRMRIESVLRITLIAAIPIGMGMSVMAEPILKTLFSGNPVEAAAVAGPLKILGIASIFVATSGAVNSMLQAVGRIYMPLKLLLYRSMIKLAVNWILISDPKINISGAPCGTLCCYLFITLAGTVALMRSVEGDIALFPMMVKPVAAGAVCCVVSRIFMKFMVKTLSFQLATIFSIAAGGLFYLIFLVILGGFGAAELELLGNNSKLRKVLRFCCLFPCK